ncbi:MAG: fatty acid desaturase family protein [Pseudomonadota bacterium]
MPRAPNVNPKEVFSDTEWAALQTRSNFKSLGMVAHAWGVIALAFMVHAIWPNPFTWLLAVMIIGTRQLGLAILMHEAAHGGLHTNQKINEWVGQWLCAAPLALDLNTYRPYHLNHHKYTQQPEDPDLGLVPDYPITRASFERKIIRDLTGQTFYQKRIKPLFGNAGGFAGNAIEATFLRAAMANFVIWLVLMAFGQGWAFVTIWLLTQATWFMMVTRIRNIGEHAAATNDINDPWQLARTIKANWLERAFIAPYHVHFHSEHHLWMHIPCYNLCSTHLKLQNKNLTQRMEIRNSYLEMLKITTGKA